MHPSIGNFSSIWKERVQAGAESFFLLTEAINRKNWGGAWHIMAKLPFLCPLKLLPDVFPDACPRYLPDAPDAKASDLS